MIGRTSADQYKNTEKSFDQIGEELGVGYLLEGSVRWEKVPGSESRIRVTPQLIKISDGTHIWTKRYDAILESVFDLQSDIAEKVANALDITLIGAEQISISQKPTDNLEAYDYYLRGKDYHNRGYIEDNFRIAEQMFEKAIELDSNFAIAMTRLAQINLSMYWYYWDRTDNRLRKSKYYIDKALEINPDLPEIYLALGQYYYHGFLDYEKALFEFDKGLKIKPNSEFVDIPADTGAARLLLEGHYLFDTIDDRMDLSGYKLVILPDEIKVAPAFKEKLDVFLASGGKILLSGSSGFDEEGHPLFDLGADCFGESEYSPDYIQVDESVCPDFVETPLVMYMRSKRIRATAGRSLGKVFDPYFNREAKHFCSHQHTPFKPDPSGYSAGVLNGQILYLAHPVFSIYRGWGSVAMAEYIREAVALLLNTDAGIATNLPSMAPPYTSGLPLMQSRTSYMRVASSGSIPRAAR